MKKWSLDHLFTSFDSPEFQATLSEIGPLIDKMTNFADLAFQNTDNAAEKLNEYFTMSELLRSKMMRAGAFCHLTMATDAMNEDARKYGNQMQELSSKTTKTSTLFSKWVPTIPNLDKLIKENDSLKEVEYYLNRIVDGSKYLLSEKEEMIISKMQNTSSSAWGQLQGELTSNLKVDYDGKEITLSQVRNLSSDPSQEVRKNAYLAELASYPKIAPSIAYAINGVKGEVNELCKLRGFDSPLAQAVYQSRMKESTLETLLSSMRDYLPHFHKYLNRKATLLGHENGLPYYDVFAPLGASKKTFSIDEAMNYIFDNFRTFGPELEHLARRAYKEEWIDFTPRAGKRGGAFCSNNHSIKESRILTNFNGSFGNVITLSHELGHAYHGDQIFAERLLNSSYTMPVAETASTFCETIVKNAALKDAVNEEKIFILDQSLTGSTQVIVDILSRFIFESDVFEKRQTTPLNERMLNEMMVKAQKEAYGSSLDPEFLMPYAWLNKSHYYRGSLSFYNFPYAFGLLFAKGIYAEFVKKGDAFVSQVNLLLRKTGQMSVEDVALLVGIDVTSKEFWNSSLDVIVSEIDLFLELTK